MALFQEKDHGVQGIGRCVDGQGTFPFDEVADLPAAVGHQHFHLGNLPVADQFDFLNGIQTDVEESTEQAVIRHVGCPEVDLRITGVVNRQVTVALQQIDQLQLPGFVQEGEGGSVTEGSVGLTAEVSKALETAYQTLLYQLGMVKSGGNKKGFLSSERKLGQEEINVLKTAWRNLYANNEENVVVLNNGLKFQEASNTAVESQLNESKKTLQDEINAIFHIYSIISIIIGFVCYDILLKLIANNNKK